MSSVLQPRGNEPESAVLQQPAALTSTGKARDTERVRKGTRANEWASDSILASKQANPCRGQQLSPVPPTPVCRAVSHIPAVFLVKGGSTYISCYRWCSQRSNFSSCCCRAVNSTPSHRPRHTPWLTGHALKPQCIRNGEEKTETSVRTSRHGGRTPVRREEGTGSIYYLSAQFPLLSAPPSFFSSVCEEP